MPREEIFSIIEGKGAVIATAIHTGHGMRASLQGRSKLTSMQQLREEDPFTDIFASAVSSRIIATQSRFQIDFNRPRERAVYRVPEDAWGLELWKAPLPSEEVDCSLQEYDAFYAALKEMLDQKLKTHKQIVVLDIHSYNHRRRGEREPFDDPMQNPEINIGTGTMSDRGKWQESIALVTDRLKDAVVMGRHLDVRENIKFQGGEMAQWIHTHYPKTVCCISLEFKKFFMNEWNGKGEMTAINEIKEVIGEIADFLETI